MLAGHSSRSAVAEPTKMANIPQEASLVPVLFWFCPIPRPHLDSLLPRKAAVGRGLFRKREQGGYHVLVNPAPLLSL